MDSLTHIALGACIGEAFFEKGFGKKAMLWGVLAQSITDIDFIASFWMSPPAALLAHRGFTHSIIFALLIIPVFAFLADKIHKPHNISFKKWLLFFTAAVFFHLFVDGFNNYGVGWFEPFSHVRYSFNAIYVADPLFSVWPGIAVIMLMVLNRHSPKRKFWWKLGLFLPLLYLGICTFNKVKINSAVKEILANQNIPHNRYFTTPAPLQNWLWYVVAGNDSGYYVGFRSIFDTKKEMTFEYFDCNRVLLDSMSNHEDLQKLIRFSKQFYTVEKYNDTLVFNDLRFGQIVGWQNPRAKFVFHYYLQHPQENKLVVQRGRFEGWNRTSIQALLKRITGN
jgi:inner membrane protein